MNNTVSQSNMFLCLIGKRNPRQDVAAKRQRSAKHFGGKAELEASAATDTSKLHGCSFDVSMV
jgi:hypothetical protein